MDVEMSRTMSYYDLRDALGQPGCPVCRLTARDAERYLDGLRWEHVNDPGVQVREAQGFCRDHAWQLDRAGASLGVAILMRDALGSVLKAMDGARFQGRPAMSLRRAQQTLDAGQAAAAATDLAAWLVAKGECPACVHVREMETGYLSTLGEQLLGEEGLLQAYRASDGPCLPHFRLAPAYLREEPAFKALVAAQTAIWRRLLDQLAEHIRKNDYRFHDEAWGDERDAWLRALGALSGGSHT